jgi:hypothetical protein
MFIFRSVSLLEKVGISIHDIEEATAKALDIIVADKVRLNTKSTFANFEGHICVHSEVLLQLLNEKTRHVFIQFLQLLVVHHPSKK